jgi:hypothetical protein
MEACVTKTVAAPLTARTQLFRAALKIWKKPEENLLELWKGKSILNRGLLLSSSDCRAVLFGDSPLSFANIRPTVQDDIETLPRPGIRARIQASIIRVKDLMRVKDFKMVGARGFEPPASWSRTRRASQAALRPDDTHSGSLEKRPEWKTQNSIALSFSLECREVDEFCPVNATNRRGVVNPRAAWG